VCVCIFMYERCMYKIETIIIKDLKLFILLLYNFNYKIKFNGIELIVGKH